MIYSLTEDGYDEVNSELRRLAAIQEEERPTTKRTFIGSGECILFYNPTTGEFKDEWKRDCAC